MNKKFRSILLEVIEVVGVAFLPLFISYQFLARPFLVWGASMEPNFKNGNYLIVDVVSYRFGEPQRGDVIIFRYPGNLSTFYIKRIIGLPGDAVSFAGRKIFVNGSSLEEDYLPDETVTESPVKTEFVLGPEEYFVMGDNRAASFDSRSWGPLPKEDIVGVVKFRVWPSFEIYRNPENK